MDPYGGERNCGIADAISKYFDTDDWGIDNESFEFIQAEYGNFTIDRFASDNNNKLPHFYSQFHCLGAENVNSFTCDWGGEFNWLCPPIGLIADTLKHAKLCSAKGVLLVPEWESAYYYPLLTSNGTYFEPFIANFLILDPYYVNQCIRKSVFTGFANRGRDGTSNSISGVSPLTKKN